MRTACTVDGPEATFLLLDTEPELEAAVRALAFRPVGDGFGQTYPSDHPHLGRIFGAFSRHAPTLVAQKAGLAPVPWADALRAFCRAVEGQGIDWWLGGSAALAVRGAAVAPGDLDLVVARDDGARLEALLIEHVVEPPRPGFISATFTRAFLHAAVEWVAGVDERADQHLVGDAGPTAAARLETVEWEGHALRVPPLDLQLAATEARGLADRAALIRGLMGRGRG